MKLVNENVSALSAPISFEHDGIPTFEECRQLIRERAFERWSHGGQRPSDGVEYWLAAERELFYGLEHGGYRIYVRDRTKPKIQDYYWHWFIKVITPDGPVDPTWEKTWRTTGGEGRAGDSPTMTRIASLAS